jgi:D-arabinose 1-dehydrogenase-like Zn-dependent alcohol dehydrogenase
MPTPREGEVLLRVRAAGVCPCDLMLLDGVHRPARLPLTPGHEVVAEVVAAAVDSSPPVGQRVLVWPYGGCGECAPCHEGRASDCARPALYLGRVTDGGWGEYLTAPAAHLVPLPSRLLDEVAVDLACSGVAAFHAAHAVGRVQPGQTVVVIGGGPWQFYLQQVCALADARVVVVGDRAETLALARELGADVCINETDVDPRVAVADLTDGRGANLVCDGSASIASLSLDLRLLAPTGRLVIGYAEGGRDWADAAIRLVGDPRVVVAAAPKLAELVQTIEQIAGGPLNSVVTPSYRLDQVDDALTSVRQDPTIHRAILLPHAPERGFAGLGDRGQGSWTARRFQRPVPPTLLAHAHTPPYVVQGALVRALLRPEVGGAATGGAPTRRTSAGGQGATGRISAGQSVPPRPFEAELLAVIQRGVDVALDDVTFNRLAREVFVFQYYYNAAYRAFCEEHGCTGPDVRHWTEIPPVPLAAARDRALVAGTPDDAAALFLSRGQMDPTQRSRHYIPHLGLYNASARANFAAHLLPDGVRVPFYVLHPSPAARPHSQLSYLFGQMLEAYGAGGSDYFMGPETPAVLHDERLIEVLYGATLVSQPVALLGTTVALFALVESLAATGETLRLPEGSRVVDTGGERDGSRVIRRAALVEGLTARLGIPREYQVNVYGLAGLSTQFYDQTLRSIYRGQRPDYTKCVPPWTRTRVLDPLTLREVPLGQVGRLCHTDLANWGSVCTVLTDDLGRMTDAGLEVLGHAAALSPA